MDTTSPRKVAVGAAVAALLGIGGLAVAAGAVDGPPDAQAPTTEAPSTTEASAPPDEPPAADAGGGHRGGGPEVLDGVLDRLVEDGTITQEQADAVTGGVQEEVEEWRDAHPRPEGHGPDGAHGGGRGFPGMQEALDAAAEVIGVEPDALRDGLRDGRSVAEIAADAGVDRQALIDAITAEATEALDGAVADGHLDADRAASLAARLPGWVESVIDLHRPR